MLGACRGLWAAERNQIDAHLLGCPKCAAELAESREMDALIRSRLGTHAISKPRLRYACDGSR